MFLRPAFYFIPQLRKSLRRRGADMSSDDLTRHSNLLSDLLIIPTSGGRSDRRAVNLLAELICFLHKTAPLLAEVPEQLPSEIVFHLISVSQGNTVDNPSTL